MVLARTKSLSLLIISIIAVGFRRNFWMVLKNFWASFNLCLWIQLNHDLQRQVFNISTPSVASLPIRAAIRMVLHYSQFLFFHHVRQFLQDNREWGHRLSQWGWLRWQLQNRYHFHKDGVWGNRKCLRSILHISCQLLWQSIEGCMYSTFILAFLLSLTWVIFLIVMHCSSTIMGISWVRPRWYSIFGSLSLRDKRILQA